MENHSPHLGDRLIEYVIHKRISVVPHLLQLTPSLLQPSLNHRFRGHVLSLAAQMGGSDYAKQVANFNVKVAAGDPESLVPNLELLSDGFKKVREALEIARKNYRETEDAHSQTFAKLRGSE